MSNRLLQFYPSATPSFFLVTTHSETWKNFIIRISIPLPFPTDEIILSVGNFFAPATFSAAIHRIRSPICESCCSTTLRIGLRPHLLFLEKPEFGLRNPLSLSMIGGILFRGDA